MLISGFVLVKWVFVPRFPVPLWNFGECDGSVLSVVLSCSTGVLTGNVYCRWILSNWDELGGNVEGESHCGPLRMGSERQLRPRKDSSHIIGNQTGSMDLMSSKKGVDLHLTYLAALEEKFLALGLAEGLPVEIVFWAKVKRWG